MFTSFLIVETSPPKFKIEKGIGGGILAAQKTECRLI